MHVHGDSPAIVGDTEAAIHVDLDVDVGAEAADGFIDAVIDQFVDEVVQAARTGVADVHAGSQADVVRVLQQLNAFVIVAFRLDSSFAIGQDIRSNNRRFIAHGCYPLAEAPLANLLSR